MKKVLFPITALILLLCLVPVLAAPAAATSTGNLLQNPGAEAGDMTPWTHSAKVAALTSQAESCGTVLPNSDSYFFSMATGPSAGPEWMEQTIDLTGLGGIPDTFEAGGWVQTEKYWLGDDYDWGALFVEFLDGEGGSLGVLTLSPVEHPVCETLTYDDFSLSGAVPDGAASAVYRLEGYLVQTGYINVFYDDLYFNVDVLPDGDGDGVPDADDNCPAVYNPDQADADGDGVGNACDNCWYTPNPDQLDSNANCPAAPYASDPVCGDACEAAPPVGGTIIPTDKSGLVMPWIVAGALIVVAGVSLAIWNRKRGGERASDR